MCSELVGCCRARTRTITASVTLRTQQSPHSDMPRGASCLGRVCRKPRCRSRGSVRRCSSRQRVTMVAGDSSNPPSVFGKATLLQSPSERVIQITRARLDDRCAEDAAGCKMTPYRPQTPCNAGAKAALRRKRHYQCDLNHFGGFEPVLSSQHQNVMHASFAGR